MTWTSKAISSLLISILSLLISSWASSSCCSVWWCRSRANCSCCWIESTASWAFTIDCVDASWIDLVANRETKTRNRDHRTKKLYLKHGIAKKKKKIERERNTKKQRHLNYNKATLLCIDFSIIASFSMIFFSKYWIFSFAASSCCWDFFNDTLK